MNGDISKLATDKRGNPSYYFFSSLKKLFKFLKAQKSIYASSDHLTAKLSSKAMRLYWVTLESNCVKLNMKTGLYKAKDYACSDKNLLRTRRNNHTRKLLQLCHFRIQTLTFLHLVYFLQMFSLSPQMLLFF